VTTSSAPGAAHDDHRRQGAQDRVGAAVEREAAAQQPGPWPGATVPQAAVLLRRRRHQDVVERDGHRAGVVSHPVPRPGRQHDEIAGAERDLARLAVHVEPATALGDDVECGVAVRPHAEAPRSPQR